MDEFVNKWLPCTAERDAAVANAEKVEAEREQEELERQIEAAREVRRFFF